MREIKFRAWHFEEGNPLYKPHMRFSSSVLWKMAIFWRNVQAEPCQVDVMQYTGLKDKNGVEIYEGDILRVCIDGYIQTPPAVVEWDDYGWLPWQAGVSDNYYRIQWSEVIGNIYDNPELLEAGK